MTIKWRDEMAETFGLDFTVIDSGGALPSLPRTFDLLILDETTSATPWCAASSARSSMPTAHRGS